MGTFTLPESIVLSLLGTALAALYIQEQSQGRCFLIGKSVA